MRFSVLTSGSKANSTYLEAAGVRILIDCGLSAKQTELRLLRLGVDPATIDAIVISHEHSDHILGAKTFSKRYKIPIFANRPTARNMHKGYAEEHFETGETFWIKDIQIHPFSIVHDAADPVGLAIQAEGLRFAHVTDLGRVTPLVREMVSGSHALVLESNHDQELLRNCSYPWELKQRISSSHGHLSNDCAAALLAEVMHVGLLHVVLAHLSENSNRPDVALATARSYLKGSEPRTLIAGSVICETPLFEVGESTSVAACGAQI